MHDIEIRNTLLNIVEELNSEIFELLEGTDLEYRTMLEYYDIGNIFGVKFLDNELFNCDNNAYEDHEGNCILNNEYFIDKIKHIVTNLNKLNLIK